MYFTTIIARRCSYPNRGIVNFECCNIILAKKFRTHGKFRTHAHENAYNISCIKNRIPHILNILNFNGNSIGLRGICYRRRQ